MCRGCKYFDTAFVGTSFATDFCRKDMQRIRDGEKKGCFETERQEEEGLESESGTQEKQRRESA